MINLPSLGLGILLYGILTASAGADAGQSEKPGPSADILPYPPPNFQGVIGKTTENSKPDFPQPFRAPKGAPNVILILTDDIGFGASSVFSGPISTPTLEALAARGIKYNRFNTTALCSPTRAALITGREQHNAHTGIIMERSLGYPGYDSVMPKSVGSIGEILRQNGYSTAWFGKNHNVPGWQTSAVGPFDLWPNGLGFEYFYGFIGGDVDQWDPTIYENTNPVEPKASLTGTKRETYHLDADLADKAIHWIQQQHALAPEKPFFVYYAPGAAHAPHHAPAEWIKKFKGQFDQGWDKLREEIFERQKKLGVIPENTILTPRPSNLPAWDSFDARHRELFAGMAETFAGFMAFDDYNIGRIIAAADAEGLLDNTLIIFLEGDNGGSAEGTLQGTANEIAVIGNGEKESFDYLYSIRDQLGGPLHYNHMPVPWSWAFNTPFQWTKRYASHFGGTRNGLVMSWPSRIRDFGGLRDQFHYVTDIMPTILEAVGVPAPKTINGVDQQPIDGISMVYTWDRPSTKSKRLTQVYELFGNRAIYHDGWIASTTPLVFAWQPEPKGLTPDSFAWELYNIDEDFSQGKNLANEMPEKLEKLKRLWWSEATTHHILPLNFSPQATVEATFQRPSLTRGRSHFVYRQGTSRIPEGASPFTKDRSYQITARIAVDSDRGDGVIVTQGGRFAGWGLVLINGRVNWIYRRSQNPASAIRIFDQRPLSPGEHLLGVTFDYQGQGNEVGAGGIFTLSVDGQSVDSARIDRTVPFIYSVDETLDIGEDHGTPIIEDYAAKMPFKFEGKIGSVVIDLGPMQVGRRAEPRPNELD